MSHTCLHRLPLLFDELLYVPMHNAMSFFSTQFSNILTRIFNIHPDAAKWPQTCLLIFSLYILRIYMIVSRCILVAADYSQIEMRVMAQLCQDKKMMVRNLDLRFLFVFVYTDSHVQKDSKV